MLERAQKVVVTILLAGVALFYANEIWRSSKSPHTPTNHSSAEHAQYEARHDNILADAWNWTTQDPVSFYTSALALFTGALVFVSIIQIRFLIRADKTATALATAAVSQSGIAGQQLAIIAAQTDIQRKAHALERLQFFATNRPILRVRYFRQTAGTHDQIQIRFAVVNAGKSLANLLCSSVVVCFADPDKLGPPVYLAGQDVVTPRNFEVGATDDYIALGTGKGAEIQNNENYGKYLFIYGYLVYSDDAGTTRTTAFGRRYLRAGERFTKIEDNDYEYED